MCNFFYQSYVTFVTFMSIEKIDYADEDFLNVVKFFELLLKVDQRNNPHLYSQNGSLEKGQNDTWQ